MPNDGILVEMVTYRAAARDGRDARRQAECVRQLRNEVVDNLTRSNKEITSDDQWAWWQSAEALARRIYIVEVATVTEPDKTFAGFGMIQPVDGVGWLTGALRAPYRGRGMGHRLFEYLIRECRDAQLAPWLEVFQDNEVAKRLYVKLGFAWVEIKSGPNGRRILVGRWSPT